MKRVITMMGLAVVSSLVMAATYKQLSGSYAIAGKNFYDPPENEPQNTHLYIVLNDAAAKDLYQIMKAKPQADVCGEKGTLTKVVGNMQCTRASDTKSYRCWFGVDVKNQKIVNGVVC